MSQKAHVWTRRGVVVAAGAAWAFAVCAASGAQGPLEGQWGGLDARGATAQVTISSGEVLAFYWGGDYVDAQGSRSSSGGTRIDFTFAGGAATLTKTASGARITIRETGRGPDTFDLKKD